MKKLLKTCLAGLLVLGLAACTSKPAPEATPTSTEPTTGETTKLKVSATLDPHAKILEFAKPILAEKGIDLEITVLDDYYIFNKALNDGEVDANYFQHVPFFEGEVEANGYKIVNAAGIHIEPFGFYSKTVKSVDDIKDGATVIISNSVADHGRILSILAKAGVITLADGVDAQNATTKDIKENPKNLVFQEVKPELLTTVFEQGEGDLVAINGNYAIQAGLNPTTDAVILEQADATNPYVNIVAVQEGKENDPAIKTLIEVLKSDEVKQFILDTYSDGSVIPAE
ncbi:MetQ/NlpA family ABC transporter substrate-binding protein [Anaerorhabdus furcosa]|uniref:Lipoprotein n=1 Tax=Anaerorhabdus furcosa TaxID=118967 RepID=A0A1T4N8J7_9FIRM|nr:MetQ/NlpA family ABC transporter substrate-binding protein [Anaerorhabdus furcosa]SJZ75531.1 D-methionine transport system substrate-binding protein [Anaerorhabdus furcosa]